MFAQYVEQKKQLHRTISFVANSAKYEYQIDYFITQLKKQEYEATTTCIDVFNKYCAIEPIKGKSDNDLALGLFECIKRRAAPPRNNDRRGVWYTD